MLHSKFIFSCYLFLGFALKHLLAVDIGKHNLHLPEPEGGGSLPAPQIQVGQQVCNMEDTIFFFWSK
jgi:hypothetical protein